MEEKKNEIWNLFPPLYEFPERDVKRELERVSYKYNLIMKYLKNTIDGHSIYEFLNGLNRKKILIYGATEFAELAIKDITRYRNDNCRIISVCDKNADKIGSVLSFDVINVDEAKQMYRRKLFDSVLVCSVFSENEIFEELIRHGIDENNIFSIVSAVFYCA